MEVKEGIFTRGGRKIFTKIVSFSEKTAKTIWSTREWSKKKDKEKIQKQWPMVWWRNTSSWGTVEEDEQIQWNERVQWKMVFFISVKKQRSKRAQCWRPFLYKNVYAALCITAAFWALVPEWRCSWIAFTLLDALQALQVGLMVFYRYVLISIEIILWSYFEIKK